MKKILGLVLQVFVIGSFALGQTPGKYAGLFNEAKLKNTIKFLSDDGFEGRGPGTRGGELAAKYIAHRLEMAGIKPGNKGSYFQPVSLVGIKANPKAKLRIANNNATFEYDFGKDFVATTSAQKETVRIDNELVFVGYGVDAPEQKWNDYKGKAKDYRGKILVMLVNDPPATSDKPDRFGGKALTYYGRWTYKYEEAARRGAAGVILIHTRESAGYGWNVVETSNGNWRYEVERQAGDSRPFLRMKSWVTNETAKRIFAQAGQNLDDLREKAKSRKFKPVNLKLRAKLNNKYEIKKVKSNNVVGFLEGRDPNRKNEYVIYTSHWDHLGIGKANPKGDKIYNGALDNASGIGQVLAISEAITKLPRKQRPKRSQIFLFTTAEEQGLLGAEWYSISPIYPLEKTAANINIDGGNFYGKTRDYGALGAERSNLSKFINKALGKRGMTFSPDSHPEQGYFFRSDHFPFAKKGVPALSIRSGSDYVGKPVGWSDQFFADYNRNHYHQPSDEFRDEWVFDGMVQVLDVTMDVAMQASNVKKLPRYNKKDEFAKAQPKRR